MFTAPSSSVVVIAQMQVACIQYNQKYCTIIQPTEAFLHLA